MDSEAVNQARAEFQATVDDLIWRYEDNCNLITREEAIALLKPPFAQLLGPSVFDAALNDGCIENNAIAKFDEAVEEFIQMAKDVDITVTREYAVRRLEPLFGKS